METFVRIHQHGGPEVMQLESVELPPPSPREVRVRHEAIGLNFIDVYQRSGLYPLPLPSGLGQEGAGVVEAVGSEVTEVAAGDRVAYGNATLGAYSSARNVAADRLVKLPPQISCEAAASIMLQGLTAQYLLRRTYRVQPGDTILIHAAAGGVGLIVCQWAKALGATVIGTVGSDEKAELARAHGCDHTIVYTREKFAERVREITGGEGLPVVYDSIGRDTFLDSLSCLRPLGMMVTFGNASGPAPAIEPGALARMGSLFLTRPILAHYVARREDLLAASADLFEQVLSGAVRVNIRQRHALADVAQAHIELEARRTTGSTILLP
ncbi:quinone oxidoreductase family protein [Uliginosibacterium sp. H1]|uniref:quinone oxidoreductase family protein n=1 Tax=Uliginosibacterium sp. H1 TaxID=3114757 RepID=UPI002E17B451|nr:quinone oxidoreductase [Uliginosibacterium sp. H1]